MSTGKPCADWTPLKGLRRAIGWALVAAALLAIPLGVLAAHAPYLVLNFWVRGALAFFVSWILFAVVHRAAGMAGTLCTIMALAGTAVVFICQHFVFAAHGVPTRSGTMILGDIWLEPTVLASTNVSTCLGLMIATMLCHGGGEIWQSVGGFLGTRIRG